MLQVKKPVLIVNLKSDVLRLSALKSRSYLQPGNQTALKLIAQQVSKFGLHYELDTFFYDDVPYSNLIVKMFKKNAPIYLFCAHFDSTSDSDKAPGADDNASGVAALLELIRITAEKKWNINLEFVFTNLEEEGHLGSEYLAEKYKKSKVELAGVINLDTIGTWKDFISADLPLAYVTDAHSMDFMQKVIEALPLPLAPCKDNWEDDHSSFWKAGFAAIELTEQGCTEFMHTRDDVADKLHYENIALIVEGLVEMLELFNKNVENVTKK